MKVSKAAMCRLLVLFAIIVCFYSNQSFVQAASEDTICTGVYIDGIDVSNMTYKEAHEAITEYIERLKEKNVGITIEDETILLTLGELGYTSEENAAIDEALLIGKKGNLIKRYKELKDANNGGIHYALEFTLDEKIAKENISSKVSKYNKPAKNASVSRQNGQFVYTDSSVGSKISVDDTYQLISDAILNEWDQQDVTVNGVVEIDQPQYSLEDVKKCNALLGTYTTNYSTSTLDRKKNVNNASNLINNSVVYPGETFSCYEVMQPFTRENGYYSAGAYAQGIVVDSIGGGVCQVSTTLYNAVLKAELEIVERAAHSMTVSYVPISFDAAIAGTYKDLKFKNNTQVPILIEAIANGSLLTFNIYGYETRDLKNRSIKFESEVISTTNPPKDVVTEDKTQPTTYRKVTQQAHQGHVAIMYKYVYENGQLVEKVQVNKSVYNATPMYVTVGTKVEEEPEDDKKEEDKKEEDKKEEDKKEDEDKNKGDKPEGSKPEGNKPENLPNKDEKPGQEDNKNDKDTTDNDEETLDKEDKDSSDQESE